MAATPASTPDPGRSSGRPRSERSRRAVLGSALELLAQQGFQALTVDGIAAHAGVSKATIYRWWAGKAAIVLDAVLDQVEREVTFPDTGDVRADLETEIRTVIRLYTGTEIGAAILDLVAASRSDPPLATALREEFFVHRRASAARVLRRAIERGELRADLDVEVVIDTVWGALYYRLLVAHTPLEPDYARALIDQVWPGLARPKVEGSSAGG